MAKRWVAPRTHAIKGGMWALTIFLKNKKN
jgi:hypothetical protein